MAKEKIRRVLEELGFSPNEIKVYLTLNELGCSKAGKIAKEAKIDRSGCYNSLKSLKEKGLVSYFLKGKVKHFQVADPEGLLEYVKEQEKDVKSILPALKEKNERNREEGQVRLFKGKRGVKTIFRDIANTGKDNYVFGSEGQFSKRLTDFAYKFDVMKEENDIHTKLIIREGREEVDSKTSEYKYLSNVSESPAVTNIYDNKIAIIIWTDEPEGVIIENQAAAKAYKSYFDFMWENAEEKPDEESDKNNKKK